jgi:phosphoribosylformimino-5-aminoimidazole carboxamide ribotide isomerase
MKSSPITTVYAGGISTESEIEAMEKLEKSTKGKMDFTVGSALDLFGGKKISYESLVEREKTKRLLNDSD